MLSKEVFKEQMQKLVILYPTTNLEVESKLVMQIWYDQFRDLDDEQFEKAVTKYISKEKWFPSVAGLKEYVSQSSKPLRLVIRDTI